MGKSADFSARCSSKDKVARLWNIKWVFYIGSNGERC